jgi:integrase/recombinase XerD
VEPEGRKLISVEEASTLINSTLDLQEKTIMTVFAKTGVRKGELISMDVGDIDWRLGGIELKPKRKRSNRKVPFDDEAAVLLGRWLKVRADYAADGEAALFIGDRGRRIGATSCMRLCRVTRRGLV